MTNWTEKEKHDQEEGETHGLYVRGNIFTWIRNTGTQVTSEEQYKIRRSKWMNHTDRWMEVHQQGGWRSTSREDGGPPAGRMEKHD